jgi:hypothetical protein
LKDVLATARFHADANIRKKTLVNNSPSISIQLLRIILQIDQAPYFPLLLISFFLIVVVCNHEVFFGLYIARWKHSDSKFGLLTSWVSEGRDSPLGLHSMAN